jgi:hypothetical protein
VVPATHTDGICETLVGDVVPVTSPVTCQTPRKGDIDSPTPHGIAGVVGCFCRWKTGDEALCFEEDGLDARTAPETAKQCRSPEQPLLKISNFFSSPLAKYDPLLNSNVPSSCNLSAPQMQLRWGLDVVAEEVCQFDRTAPDSIISHEFRLMFMCFTGLQKSDDRSSTVMEISPQKRGISMSHRRCATKSSFRRQKTIASGDNHIRHITDVTVAL